MNQLFEEKLDILHDMLKNHKLLSLDISSSDIKKIEKRIELNDFLISKASQINNQMKERGDEISPEKKEMHNVLLQSVMALNKENIIHLEKSRIMYKNKAIASLQVTSAHKSYTSNMK